MILQEFFNKNDFTQFLTAALKTADWPNIDEKNYTYTFWVGEDPEIGFFPALREGRRQVAQKVQDVETEYSYHRMAYGFYQSDSTKLDTKTYAELLQPVAEICAQHYYPVLMVTEKRLDGVRATYLFIEAD